VGFWGFNRVLLRELVRDVERNEGGRDVGFREVSRDIADGRKIVGMMIGDLKTCFEKYGVKRSR
jgi:hypothetical protein